MLEVLRQDYVLAARAGGLSERLVIFKYALRNAISPVLTYTGLIAGTMLTYAPLTETVFNWPGLGYRLVTAALGMDYPVVMGITMIVTAMTLAANLITDLCYAIVDPRVRIG
jgi:peptide/nickel transport system permease protein